MACVSANYPRKETEHLILLQYSTSDTKHPNPGLFVGGGEMFTLDAHGIKYRGIPLAIRLLADRCPCDARRCRKRCRRLSQRGAAPLRRRGRARRLCCSTATLSPFLLSSLETKMASGYLSQSLQGSLLVIM